MSRENADKIAIVNARVACALITMEGMKAENRQRKWENKSNAYTENDFTSVINDYAIGENDVIGFLYHS
jgi:hypothetical protein